MVEQGIRPRVPWIESPLKISGAGGGRLDFFHRPMGVNDLVTIREKVVRPGLTNGEEVARSANLLLDLQPGQVLADLGCGPGLIGKYLEPLLGETGWLYCLDASPLMLDYTRKVLFGKKATLIHGDIHVVDRLIPEKIDAAILSGNVHLLANRGMAFGAIKKMLKPDGKLVVITHAFYYHGTKAEQYRFAATIDQKREVEPGHRIDGLRLPMLSEKELLGIVGILGESGFLVDAYENDSWASDMGAVFGINPLATVAGRLRVLYPEESEPWIDQTAQAILGDVHRGTQAQVYLLCTPKSTRLGAKSSARVFRGS